MSQGKAIIFMLVILFVGFAGGFVLRPVIEPPQQTAGVAPPSPVTAAPSEVRGAQYFVAHIDEARQVVAGCRNGSVRGGECATAEEANIKVDAQQRRKQFLGN
jgi:hypothetical protein